MKNALSSLLFFESLSHSIPVDTELQGCMNKSDVMCHFPPLPSPLPPPPRDGLTGTALRTCLSGSTGRAGHHCHQMREFRALCLGTGGGLRVGISSDSETYSSNPLRSTPCCGGRLHNSSLWGCSTAQGVRVSPPLPSPPLPSPPLPSPVHLLTSARLCRAQGARETTESAR